MFRIKFLFFHNPFLLILQLFIIYTFLLTLFTGMHEPESFGDYGPFYYTIIRNCLFGNGTLYLSYTPYGFISDAYVYIYPPLTTIFFLPFVLIPNYQLSLFLWISLEIFLSFYLLKLMFNYLNDKKKIPWIICAMLGSIEWLFEIEVGNISLNMLMLVFISLFKLCRSGNFRSKYFWAFVLGFACSFKFFPFLFIIMLLTRKKYSELIITFLSFFLFVSSFIWTGIIFDKVYLSKALTNSIFQQNSIWYQLFFMFTSDSNLIWFLQILIVIVFSFSILFYLLRFQKFLSFSTELYLIYSIILLIVPMPQSSFFLGSFLFIFFLLEQKRYEKLLTSLGLIIYFMIPGAFYLYLWKFLESASFYPNKFDFVIFLQLFNIISLILSLILIRNKRMNRVN